MMAAVSRAEFAVRRAIGALIGVSPDSIDLASTFTELGIASDLMANLIATLNADLGIGLPAAADNPSIAVSTLITYVTTELDRLAAIADQDNYPTWLAGAVG